MKYIVQRGADGLDYWELSGEILSFAIMIERDGVDWDVYPNLSKYTSEEEKAVRYGESKEDFVDRHFLYFRGVRPKIPSVHRQYLNTDPNLKEFLYEEGVQGIRNRVTPKQEDVLEDSDSIETRLIQEVYNPAFGSRTVVLLNHVLEWKEEYFERYNDCVSNEPLEDEIQIGMDWDEVEAIYDESLIRTTGYLLEGRSYSDSEHSQRLALMPFEHKFVAVDEAYRPARMRV